MPFGTPDATAPTQCGTSAHTRSRGRPRRPAAASRSVSRSCPPPRPAPDRPQHSSVSASDAPRSAAYSPPLLRPTAPSPKKSDHSSGSSAPPSRTAHPARGTARSRRRGTSHGPPASAGHPKAAHSRTSLRTPVIWCRSAALSAVRSGHRPRWAKMPAPPQPRRSRTASPRAALR